jgi:hypothetical protein
MRSGPEPAAVVRPSSQTSSIPVAAVRHRAEVGVRPAMLAGCSLCASLKRTGGIVRKDAQANAVV